MELMSFVGPVSSAIFYGLSLLSGVFLSGWFLNSKLKTMCKESNEEVVDEMAIMKVRITKLEDESVKNHEHERDMKTMFSLVNELKDDIRNGFTSVTKRIDDIFLAKRD